MELELAKATLTGQFYWAAAFASHQAAEKALKGAFIELRRAMPPQTHSLPDLGTALGVPAAVMHDLRLLNPHYTTSRYPDAANAAPADIYDVLITQPLLEAAQRVLTWVDSVLTKTP